MSSNHPSRGEQLRILDSAQLILGQNYVLPSTISGLQHAENRARRENQQCETHTKITVFLIYNIVSVDTSLTNVLLDRNESSVYQKCYYLEG